jgi:hypothetical protein
MQIAELILWTLYGLAMLQALLVALALVLGWRWQPRAGRREGEALDAYTTRLERENVSLKDLLDDAASELEVLALSASSLARSEALAAAQLAARLRTALKRLEER